jgi:hypothetical protein
LGAIATVTSFPLSKHTGGGGVIPTFSGLCIYLQFTWEVSLPPSPVGLSSHSHFYKLSRPWLLGVCRLSYLLQLACCEGFPSPPFGSQGTSPSLLVSFLLLLFIIQFVFSLFSLGGGRSVQGAMLIWLRVVCGSTVCRLAHLVVCIFPSGLGSGVWQRRIPPGFSV